MNASSHRDGTEVEKQTDPNVSEAQDTLTPDVRG
jgi:hypothetical protein